MTYVDLNPVRASVAKSLEDSEFTGAYDRIMARKAEKRLEMLEKEKGGMEPEQVRQAQEEIDASLSRERILQGLDGDDSRFSFWWLGILNLRKSSRWGLVVAENICVSFKKILLHITTKFK